MPQSRARVYIDGFNLYYGALKGTRYKWLDLSAWVDRLLPSSTCDRIAYCTAPVKVRPDNPQAGQRQEIYLRALSTLPNVEVIKGQFQVKTTRMPLNPDPQCECCGTLREGCRCCEGPTVGVVKTEEKGSDVNVAVQLVADGFMDRYDVALVISGDSDIQPAVDIVREKLGKQVITLDPRNRRYRPLVGDEHRRARAEALGACQFPEVITTSGGQEITRPPTW